MEPNTNTIGLKVGFRFLNNRINESPKASTDGDPDLVAILQVERGLANHPWIPVRSSVG